MPVDLFHKNLTYQSLIKEGDKIYRFIEKKGGIEYLIYHHDNFHQYFISDMLVRDRQANIKIPDNCIVNKEQFFLSYEEKNFICKHGVWSPSIDSLVLVDYLKHSQKSYSNVFDVDCGVGFISLFLEEYCAIENISFYDHVIACYPSVVYNHQINNSKTTISFVTEYPKKTVFDASFMTSMYFPTWVDNVKEYVDYQEKILQEYINRLEHCYRISKDTYFIFSDIVSDKFDSKINIPYKIVSQYECEFSLVDYLNPEIANFMIKSKILKPGGIFPTHTIYLGLSTNDNI